MRSICIAVILSLSLTADALAQKRTKQRPSSRSRAATREIATNDSAANKPRIIGSQVVIITKNDDRITGTLLDLTAYSVRIKSDNLESTLALDTLSSLSFGSAAPVAKPMNVPARADFTREASTVISSFQAIAAQLKAGTEFTEYGRQLGDLRRTGEQFTARYSSTNNPTEARIISLLAGALTDYSWARTIWTMKFGRSSDGAVNETDSPLIADALALYPDVRAAATTGNKFSVDKIVSGLWRKAAEYTDQARDLIAQPK